MKRATLLILTFFLFSCQTLPVINPPSSLINKKSFACPFPFLKEKYRLVHAIEARMAGDTRSAIIGVTLADPVSRSVSCAIMTAEGMVLFEAETSLKGIKVSRALPPFDSENFAKNMIEDIKLIFLAPKGKIQARGFLPDGTKACRYLQENGDWVDVIENKPEGMEIKRYSFIESLKRHVKFNKTKDNIYQNIELQAYETFDYSLLMTLIESQPVKKQAVKRK
jgi:hypothetical protein